MAGVIIEQEKIRYAVCHIHIDSNRGIYFIGWNIRFMLCCLIGFMFFSPTCPAQDIPRKISFQGKLQENGIPVNGTKTLTFQFSGTDWSETHQNVNIANGLYSVQLGSINPIPETLFTENAGVYLSISVDGEVLTPEVEILTVPYAYKSLRAIDADKLDGSNPEVFRNVESINNMRGDTDGNIAIEGGENVSVESGNNRVVISADTAGIECENNLTMIRGTINPDGTVFQGVGFTCSHDGPGQYTISFSTPFSSEPTVVVSARGSAPPDPYPWFLVVNVETVTTTSFNARLRYQQLGGTANPIDHVYKWDFIAVGLR